MISFRPGLIADTNFRTPAIRASIGWMSPLASFALSISSDVTPTTRVPVHTAADRHSSRLCPLCR